MSALPIDEQDLAFLAERLQRTIEGPGWEEEWILEDDVEEANSDDGDPESSECEDESDDEDEEDNDNRRTQDPYANTSLQETRLPVPTPEDFYHDQEYEDRRGELFEAVVTHDIDLLRRQRAYMQETRQENELASAADRRADRLNAHRAKASGLVDLFSHTLRDWKEEDPSAYTKFITYMTNASQASQVPARSFAMLLWFPQLPHAVAMAIRDLVRHYHLDAALLKMVDSTQMNGVMVNGRRVTELPSDLYHAADRTSAQDMKPDRTLAFFSNQLTNPGEEEARVKHIRANFEARKVFLESLTWKCNNDDELRSPEDIMLEWCRGADLVLLRFDTVAAMNAKHVTRATKKAFAKLQNEIADMKDHLRDHFEELSYIQTTVYRDIVNNFYKWRRAQDQASKAALKAKIEKYWAEVEEFEKKYPVLAARELPDWRRYRPIEEGDGEDGR